ncbi:hypothetical protein ABZ464_04875 [Streptomyces sp. NPDC005820]|uniref:hypothetical protein n=1 Tax=Streptomyces sp. NPDC005820 TaxID=3157069 RepID=UPI00340FC365
MNAGGTGVGADDPDETAAVVTPTPDTARDRPESDAKESDPEESDPEESDPEDVDRGDPETGDQDPDGGGSAPVVAPTPDIAEDRPGARATRPHPPSQGGQ